MPGQKKVVVFCPRGRQGESVCRYLAQDPQYEVFAVTRLAKDLENIGEASVFESRHTCAHELVEFHVTGTNITSTQDVQAVGGQLPEEALKAFEGLKKLGVNLVYGDFLDASTFPQLLHGAFGCWWNVSCEPRMTPSGPSS